MYMHACRKLLPAHPPFAATCVSVLLSAGMTTRSEKSLPILSTALEALTETPSAPIAAAASVLGVVVLLSLAKQRKVNAEVEIEAGNAEGGYTPVFPAVQFCVVRPPCVFLVLGTSVLPSGSPNHQPLPRHASPLPLFLPQRGSIFVFFVSWTEMRQRDELIFLFLGGPL